MEIAAVKISFAALIQIPAQFPGAACLHLGLARLLPKMEFAALMEGHA